MAKSFEMYSLLDLYGCLLTEKQLNIMNMYYNDDLSLGEIAQQCSISRQGVHDAVKHCEKALADYEQKLGLSDREWYCPQCGEYHIRDVNSAMVILRRGMAACGVS